MVQPAVRVVRRQEQIMKSAHVGALGVRDQSWRGRPDPAAQPGVRRRVGPHPDLGLVDRQHQRGPAESAGRQHHSRFARGSISSSVPSRSTHGPGPKAVVVSAPGSSPSAWPGCCPTLGSSTTTASPRPRPGASADWRTTRPTTAGPRPRTRRHLAAPDRPGGAPARRAQRCPPRLRPRAPLTRWPAGARRTPDRPRSARPALPPAPQRGMEVAYLHRHRPEPEQDRAVPARAVGRLYLKGRVPGRPVGGGRGTWPGAAQAAVRRGR